VNSSSVNSSPKHHPTIENTDFVLEEEFEEKEEEAEEEEDAEEEHREESNERPTKKARGFEANLKKCSVDWNEILQEVEQQQATASIKRFVNYCSL
jgi:hypothetical protein